MGVKREIIRLKLLIELLAYYVVNRHWEYRREFRFWLRNGHRAVPYPTIKRIVPDGGWDERVNLPYVNHKGKRLYYALKSLKEALRQYKFSIEDENLLGGGYKEKAPHQYQTETFKVEDGDILVDVGCAEAILALDVIDKVGHAFLFESDPKWIPALEATFAPYKEKVTIIGKYVGNRDSQSSVRLDTALSCVSGRNMFIKMDIEGNELEVLRSSEEFLKVQDNIKVACCTYHKSGDAEEIKRFFEKIGYHTEFSEGVMWFIYYDYPTPPYFRHGVIRAKK